MSCSTQRAAAPRTGIGSGTCPRWALGAVVLLLAIHVAFLAYSAVHHGPTVNEIGHLPAGIAHWELGDFSLYRVNPPLVRMVATLPIYFFLSEFSLDGYGNSLQVRQEYVIGERLLRDQGAASFRLFVVARLAALSFSLLGGCVCFIYALRLYGATSGLVTLALWCFSPSILTHGELITPDVGAAACGILSVLTFRSWLYEPTWRTASWAGICLGLANLAKFTWVTLFVLYAILWLGWRLTIDGRSRAVEDLQGASDPRGFGPKSQVSWGISLLQLAAVLGLGLLVINAGYGFAGSGAPLGEYQFVSETLGGDRASDEPFAFSTGNRFHSTWLAWAPVPLPKEYLQGMDILKHEFEVGLPSYLRGEWKHGGWYHYYLYAILVKAPLGVLLMGAATALWTLTDLIRRRMSRREVFDELLLLSPAVLVLLMVSSQTGFNHHLRYVIPAFPFLFVWMGKLGQWCAGISSRVSDSSRSARASDRSWSYLRQGFLLVSLGSVIVSSLSIYPHSHSYFNILVGGPKNGWKLLHDSNIDWGQDITYLQSWLREHPEADPIGVALFLPVPASQLGIPSFDPNRWPVPEEDRHLPAEQLGPQPGWYAISVCHLAGEVDWGRSWKGRPSHDYENEPSRSYFQHFDPVERIGCTINIYHVTPEQCNYVRRILGLEELPDRLQAVIE